MAIATLIPYKAHVIGFFNNIIVLAYDFRTTFTAILLTVLLKEWYCTLCVQEYRDFYYRNKTILDQGGFVGDFNEEFYKTFL